MPPVTPPPAPLIPPPPAPARAASARAVCSRDPATGDVWASFDAVTVDGVRAAVARARAAQPAWAARPMGERVRLVRRLRDVMYRRRQEGATIISRENGKSVSQAIGGEVVMSMDFAAYYARIAPGMLRPETRFAQQLAFWRKVTRVHREPYGVIGIISPWNYPLLLAAGGAIPALLCGNTVVLKPSEFTPSSADWLLSCAREAGIPDDVFQVVQGDGATGAALASAEVDKVFFTGSVATGRKVAHACAERLVPCTLELGGSDAAIVLADADLSYAASGIAWGRFANAGQTCVAPKRVFVEAAVHDRFVQALARVVGQLRVGAGTDPYSDVNAVIRPEAVATLQAQRDDAVARGATVAAQGAGGDGAGYFPPTVLTALSPESRPLTEETFGPLLAVVPVRDEEEALRRANDSPFGLSGSVWTRDAARGRRIAQRLQAGTVMINDSVAVVGFVNVPYGGVKESGIGRQHGPAGIEECVRPKAVVDDLFTSWRQPWWFGYSPRYATDIDAYLTVAHAPSWLARLTALPKVVRLIFFPERPV